MNHIWRMFEKNLCLIVKEGSIYSLVDKENGREGSAWGLYNVLTHPAFFFPPKMGPMLEAWNWTLVLTFCKLYIFVWIRSCHREFFGGDVSMYMHVHVEWRTCIYQGKWYLQPRSELVLFWFSVIESISAEARFLLFIFMKLNVRKWLKYYSYASV